MILDIVTGSDNAVLRAESKPVKNITPEIKKLVRDMHETLAHTENGIGLAAPQAGKNLRMFVIALEVAQDEHHTFINPEILQVARNTEEMEEGCLSLPGQWHSLGRPKKVTVRAQDENGNSFVYHARGLLARLMVHEVDHLNGTLFIDHL